MLNGMIEYAAKVATANAWATWVEETGGSDWGKGSEREAQLQLERWAAQEDGEPVSYGAGAQLMDECPITPRDVLLWAKDLFWTIVRSTRPRATGRKVSRRVQDWSARARFTRRCCQLLEQSESATAQDLAYALVMESLGTGVGWEDDPNRPSHLFKVPYTELSLWYDGDRHCWRVDSPRRVDLLRYERKKRRKHAKV